MTTLISNGNVFLADKRTSRSSGDQNKRMICHNCGESKGAFTDNKSKIIIPSDDEPMYINGERVLVIGFTGSVIPCLELQLFMLKDNDIGLFMKSSIAVPNAISNPWPLKQFKGTGFLAITTDNTGKRQTHKVSITDSLFSTSHYVTKSGIVIGHGSGNKYAQAISTLAGGDIGDPIAHMRIAAFFDKSTSDNSFDIATINNDNSVSVQKNCHYKSTSSDLKEFIMSKLF